MSNSTLSIFLEPFCHYFKRKSIIVLTSQTCAFVKVKMIGTNSFVQKYCSMAFLRMVTLHDFIREYKVIAMYYGYSRFIFEMDKIHDTKLDLLY